MTTKPKMLLGSDLDKMRICCPLLPDPAPEEMLKLLDHIDAQQTELTRLRGENERLRDAIYWALGEGDEFPLRNEGQGSYWWRRELRARSGLPVKSALDEKGEVGNE